MELPALMVQDRQGRTERVVAHLIINSCVIFMHTGPLPEPVVNGGMEEKVRFTSSKVITETMAG